MSLNPKALLAPALIVLVVLAAFFIRLFPGPQVMQGDAEATRILVSSKAGGRVEAIRVQRGDAVTAGQVLLTLSNPELAAQIDAARANLDAITARVARSQAGNQREDIQVLKNALAEAQAQAAKARTDFERASQVARQGYISKADLDTARSRHDIARAQEAEARSRLQKAEAGDRPEDRAALAAEQRQAEAGLAQLLAQAEDTAVHAPRAGEIGSIAVEAGELVGIRSPLLTLIDTRDMYFIFNVPETQLEHLKTGDRITLRVPGLGNRQVETELRYIAVMGDFATRKATRASGDFDLKTFELRLYPLEIPPGLRPGMSALWTLKKR